MKSLLEKVTLNNMYGSSTFLLQCPILIMSYDEQQIHYSLKRVEEEEQITHLRWQRDFAKLKYKESDISQWIRPSPEKIIEKRHSGPYIKERYKDKDRRYSYLLQLLNQTGKGFYKYQNAPYRAEKPKDVAVSPKKIDLKLPLPQIFQDSESAALSSRRQSSLPLIKKVAQPLRVLRRQDKQKSSDKDKETQASLKWIQQHSDFFVRKNDIQLEDINRKSKMQGTRRLQKGFPSFSERLPRQSLDNNRLKECITFMK